MLMGSNLSSNFKLYLNRCSISDFFLKVNFIPRISVSPSSLKGRLKQTVIFMQGCRKDFFGGGLNKNVGQQGLPTEKIFENRRLNRL